MWQDLKLPLVVVVGEVENKGLSPEMKTNNSRIYLYLFTYSFISNLPETSFLIIGLHKEQHSGP